MFLITLLCFPCERVCSRVGQSAFCFFPPCTSPRWSDRGSTDPSISGCLDSLPSVHHGADPRPPSRSLHLPGGRCCCCSPPRPGEGPTGVCFSYLHFPFSSIVSYTCSSDDTGSLYRHRKWMPPPRYATDYHAWITTKCMTCVKSCSVQVYSSCSV